MLRAGCVVLTLWTVLNLIPSAWILWTTLARGGHTPALYVIVSKDEVDALSDGVLATIDSIAVYANGLNIAFCTLALCVIWRGLGRRRAWTFWALLAGFAAAFAGGMGGGYEVGFPAPAIDLFSAGILATGLGLAALGLFRAPNPREQVP